MKFPTKYKLIKSESYSDGVYELIPIRYEDRLDIMKWRNDQISHLRQKEPLTKEQQDKYFNEVVAKLFEIEYPDQILFSYLENGKCIGYGGLVHIDWYSKNAEISFIIDPALEKQYFNLHWKNYLSFLYKYAFDELNLHKVYTYAFDIRPYLYPALEEGGLTFETRLKEHFLFEDKYKDVVIHAKFNPLIFDPTKFYLNKVDIKDAKILFDWSNEVDVRKNSFNSEKIEWENHLKWLEHKLNTANTYMYLLCHPAIKCPLGQIRIDFSDELKAWNIGYSIDKLYRGMGLSKVILNLIKDKCFSQKLHAEIKVENTASIRAFKNTGFKKVCEKDDIVIYQY